MVSDVVEFNCAARSDVGLLRASNQDSAYAGSHLLVLADGMGGHAGGDIASSVAVAHFAPLDTDTHPADSLLPLLNKALAQAHEDLTERSHLDPELIGLGTTVIALMRSGNKLAMVHIGDSRAYLLRDHALVQVTTDHSFVQYLVDTGQITKEEAEHHPQRNVVMRILGDSDTDSTPDETIREAVIGDRWLLCSDGLSGVVSDETIANVLAEISDPGECAEQLIQLALRAGGPDNITCIVADVVPTGTQTFTQPQIVGAAAVDHAAPSRGGTGAAARAAALRPTPALTSTHNDTPISRRRNWKAPALAFCLSVILVVAGWLGWAWTQTQYYALAVNGYVVIHQGIPQSIGPWKFSHPVVVTDIRTQDLTPVDRQRLTEPVTRSSREDIDSYISQLRLSSQKSMKESTPRTGQSGADTRNTQSSEIGESDSQQNTPQSEAVS
ncbi:MULTISPECIES: PP2C family protein-serine/threonine phosphatase [unclassified Schaalia]|uniref:PP2C family protein-serine/threonine phosphatase n=1 Tax=unclassified Schaalia TaxID=2691889 RepID=UPI001E4D0AA1|nr:MULTISPECIES: PP2C family serine/threonine-protein phosphatase [unclassified Schaalia]MCD4550021.1 protein phosphatase 2C domain-containing protein [Schaalia sp. lx-260]MCD4557911.1 protein phosphatase 2C domain-containing protein [Schaalia sp. lx-100]